MRRLSHLTVLLALAMTAGSLLAQDAQNDLLRKKFGEDNLVDIGFCFGKFVEAVGAGDAVTVRAFLFEPSDTIKKLDLNNEGQKTTLLNQFAKFKGAQIVSSQRMAITGIGIVKYQDASGAMKEGRMKNEGGIWKISND